MINYDYRCDTDGLVQSRHRMGTAPATICCPLCHEPARRAYSAPAVTRPHDSVDTMLAIGGASADRPRVVTTVRSASTRPVVGGNPRLQALPRR